MAQRSPPTAVGGGTGKETAEVVVHPLRNIPILPLMSKTTAMKCHLPLHHIQNPFHRGSKGIYSRNLEIGAETQPQIFKMIPKRVQSLRQGGKIETKIFAGAKSLFPIFLQGLSLRIFQKDQIIKKSRSPSKTLFPANFQKKPGEMPHFAPGVKPCGAIPKGLGEVVQILLGSSRGSSGVLIGHPIKTDESKGHKIFIAEGALFLSLLSRKGCGSLYQFRTYSMQRSSPGKLYRPGPGEALFLAVIRKGGSKETGVDTPGQGVFSRLHAKALFQIIHTSRKGSGLSIHKDGKFLTQPFIPNGALYPNIRNKNSAGLFIHSGMIGIQGIPVGVCMPYRVEKEILLAFGKSLFL
jgi:hypothetical protein